MRNIFVFGKPFHQESIHSVNDKTINTQKH